MFFFLDFFEVKLPGDELFYSKLDPSIGGVRCLFSLYSLTTAGELLFMSS